VITVGYRQQTSVAIPAVLFGILLLVSVLFNSNAGSRWFFFAAWFALLIGVAYETYTNAYPLDFADTERWKEMPEVFISCGLVLVFAFDEFFDVALPFDFGLQSFRVVFLHFGFQPGDVVDQRRAQPFFRRTFRQGSVVGVE
jgi:hypothetical protein